MRLKSISYAQFDGDPREWGLAQLDLRDQNLIVGVNASGKSKTLHLINNFARLVRGETKPTYESSAWKAVFSAGDDDISYELSIQNGGVVKENFGVGGRVLLSRGEGGKGTIWAEQLKQDIEFQTPPSDVAAAARRDSVQHPFLEILGAWANGVYKFDFRSELLGKSSIVVQLNHVKVPDIDPRDPTRTVAVYRKAEKEYAEEFATAMRTDMAKLRYPIDEIGTCTPSVQVDAVLPGPPIALYVKESDLSTPTDQYEMSEGMFRAFALLIHLNYAKLTNRPSLILIDDIGEGLDFDRSCLLIGIVREKARASNVQLLMTTNDRFVMNHVPLEDWSVLRRSGGLVKVHNYANSKPLFDDFKLTGLNNFDFFAMEFSEGEPHGAQ